MELHVKFHTCHRSQPTAKIIPRYCSHCGFQQLADQNNLRAITLTFLFCCASRKVPNQKLGNSTQDGGIAIAHLFLQMWSIPGARRRGIAGG
uniref:Uncharacterized protein n=1 Tax=Arundo donax TaxID=35708 RepID=A0A0A9CD35_ARUDO